MLKKLLNIFLVLTFLGTIIYAQSAERVILRPNGEQINLNKSLDLKEAIKIAKIKDGNGIVEKSSFMDPNFNVTGTLDTLGGGLSGTNFGFFGQDVFMQYFVAPADLTIKGAGFNTSDDAGAAAGVTLRLIKLNWDYETLKSVDADLHMGRYPADGNGYNNIDYFGEKGATGPWEDLTDGAYPLPPWADNADPTANTWDYDLWSDGGDGAPFIPVNDGAYQWVETSVLGFEPEIKQGEVFAVVLEHQGTTLDGDRIGVVAEVVGVPGWKFYQNPRSSAGTEGWHARTYSWDFVVAVDLTGDRGPVVAGVTQLPTTLSTDARTVSAVITDDNPSGGAAGLATTVVSYTTDGTTFTDIAMTADADTFSADIPGQSPGTEVTYFVSATDVGGNTTNSKSVTYSIFEATENTLVIFDGQSGSGYPSAYYFGQDDFVNYSTIDFPHDTWAFGGYDETLLNNYTNVFEFVTGGPNFYQRDALTSWLAADPTRNYFLAGQEWLGVDNGFVNQTYAAGSFEYDVLGVAASYNDVSYAEDAGQGLPSKLMAVEGSLLGDPMYQLFQQNGPTDSLQYDPVGEISVNNWGDGFDAVDPANVDMMIETRGIDNVVDVQNKACAAHNVTGNGNKTVFMSIDPIAINSSPDYYWYGFSKTSIQSQTLTWFGVPVDVRQVNDAIPNKFTLNQNYPNPFNPSTSIEFAVPEKGLVTLRIYNILGQEVAQVLNKNLAAGSYNVDFDASQLTSGMYIYSLQAGNVEISKKMMLLK